MDIICDLLWIVCMFIGFVFIFLEKGVKIIIMFVLDFVFE